MKISRILQIAATLCFFAFIASAQNISVASFKMDEMDLTANQQGTIVLDQNGEKCALIKVINPNSGFTFDVGSLGVMKIEQHTNETWVYVPAGIRRMTINHPQLGQLRDYQFPVNIARARTYVMELTTGQVHVTVKNAVVSQYVVFELSPSNSMVELDGHTLETVDGIASRRMPFGTYTYRVTAPKYKPYIGSVVVNDHNNRHVVNLSLDPQFGIYTFEAPPDAEVWANDKKLGQGKCTADLDFGVYILECRSLGCRTTQCEMIMDASNSGSVIKLDSPVPLYGSLDVDSVPSNAKIYLDGNMIGLTPMCINLCKIGPHNVTLRRDGYHDYIRTVEVKEGESSNLSACLEKATIATTVPSNSPSGSDEYLHFIAEEPNSSVMLAKKGRPYPVKLEYSFDMITWRPYRFGKTVILKNISDKIYLRNQEDGIHGFSKNKVGHFYTFYLKGRIAASGNVMSLIDKSMKATSVMEGCFHKLFISCIQLTKAPELPATTLAEACYLAMFRNCTGLTRAPELPATTLAEACYGWMFDGCSSLTKAPELPATTLATDCYQGMFENCTSLTKAPELPATTLATECYRWMFDGCSSLTKAPELPATTLAEGCYAWMFYGCSNLQYLKVKTTKTKNHYTDMKDWLTNTSSSGVLSCPKGLDDIEYNIPSGWKIERF